MSFRETARPGHVSGVGLELAKAPRVGQSLRPPPGPGMSVANNWRSLYDSVLAAWQRTFLRFKVLPSQKFSGRGVTTY